MANYQWAENNGMIVEAAYNEAVDRITSEQAKDELINSLSLFGNQVTCTMRNNINYVYDIVSTDLQGHSDEYMVCIREMTPGGRKGLKNEQRIQPEAQQINAIYDANNLGKKAVLMGVYKRAGITIFCAWKANYSSAAIHTTGISKQIKITSIAKAIKEGFVQQLKGHGEYACAFRKEFIYFYINNYSWLHGETVEELTHHIPESGDSEIIQHVSFNRGYNTDYERNRIVFGAPGTGKSYQLKLDAANKKTDEDSEAIPCFDEAHQERVTFHPAYSYAQFFGNFKPVSKKSSDSSKPNEIEYRFVPGPFLRVLLKALANPSQNYLLVIEEINRANVAAVFGDVFQLLDRKSGKSEYPISISDELYDYIMEDFNTQVESKHYEQEINIPEHEKKIIISSNMYIWATMNSADQGVMPMDTAFKRRWNFEYIDIDAGDGKIENTTVSVPVGDKKYQEFKWNDLRKHINSILSDKKAGIPEDKQLGPFFIQKSILDSIDNAADDKARQDANRNFVDTFKNKVLMYLFEDAAQYCHTFMFGDEYTSFAKLCADFNMKGVNIILGFNAKDVDNKQPEPGTDRKDELSEDA